MSRVGYRFSRAAWFGGLIVSISAGITLVSVHFVSMGPDDAPQWRARPVSRPAANRLDSQKRRSPAAALRFSPVKMASKAGALASAAGVSEQVAVAGNPGTPPPAGEPTAALAQANADAPARGQAEAPAASALPVLGEFTFRFDSPLRQQLDDMMPDGQPARVLFPVTESRVVDLAITKHDARDARQGELYALVDDRKYADAVLAYVDDAVAGTIVTPEGELFQVRYAGGGVHRVTQLDPERMPGEVEPLVPPVTQTAALARRSGADRSRLSMAAASMAPLAATAENAPQMQLDSVDPGIITTPDGGGAPPMAMDPTIHAGDNVIVNVMIVYTTQSQINNGGVSGMNALINAAVAKANLAFSNSGVGLSIRVAHTMETAYVGSGSVGTDLGRLQNASDGFMDDVYSARALYGADLVSLFVTSGSDGAGVAYLLNPEGNGAGNINWTFSVVIDSAADGNITFGHEVGHNFGCGHGMGNGGGVFSYANGYRFNALGQQYRTVMAYAPGIRIPYFSNPSVAYGGVLTGTSATNNNALTLTRGRAGNASLYMTGSDLTVAAQGDINGDTKPDLIWRNVYNGLAYVVTMDGISTLTQSTLLSGYREWVPTITGDFNGDSKIDVVWRNTTTGLVNVVLMDGTTKLSTVSILPAGWSVWMPMVAGDFNGDNKTDMLWRHSGTGQVNIWYMDGSTRTSQVTLWAPNDTSWVPMAGGDFNGDNKPDVIWRHAPTGRVVINFMDGLAKTGSATLLEGLNPAAEAPWRPLATGDFNGDGETDIVWRNTSTGEVWVWYMNDAVRTSKALIAS
jgi:hypothetical protein